MSLHSFCQRTGFCKRCGVSAEYATAVLVHCFSAENVVALAPRIAAKEMEAVVQGLVTATKRGE